MFQDKRLKDAVRAAEERARRLRPRLHMLDQALATIGREIASILLLVLMLAILCAPAALGLAVAWGIWIATMAVTASPVLAWIVTLAMVAFYCRHVWAPRLQGAARRAAAALLAPLS